MINNFNVIFEDINRQIKEINMNVSNIDENLNINKYIKQLILSVNLQTNCINTYLIQFGYLFNYSIEVLKNVSTKK